MLLELGLNIGIDCADTSELRISYGYACHGDIVGGATGAFMRKSNAIPQ